MKYVLKVKIEGKSFPVIDMTLLPIRSNFNINIAFYTVKFTQIYNQNNFIGIEFSNDMAKLQQFQMNFKRLLDEHSDKNYRSKLYRDILQPTELLFQNLANKYNLEFQMINE